LAFDSAKGNDLIWFNLPIFDGFVFDSSVFYYCLILWVIDKQDIHFDKEGV